MEARGSSAQAGLPNPLIHAAGVAMFPEYRDLITRLKAENKTFARLFDEHNELDQRVKNIEAHAHRPGHR